LDNNARSAAFGTGSSLVIPGHAVSVKTGTTDDLRDNWTIGYTPQYLSITWVGNNDNTPMNPALVSGVTGAAPIWNRIMRHVLEDKPDIWPKQPEGIVGAQVCSLTGKLPPGDGDDRGCPIRFEYFIRGTVPSEREVIRQTVHIDTTTGDIAEPGQTENIEFQEHDVISDGITTWCLDCPHPEGKTVTVR
jgi:membrane carboxypeptidase/penicillin-binding protein PbpC